MADPNTIAVPAQLQFPKYQYSFVVQNLNFDSSNIVVEFTPANTELTKITLSLPIMANFDPSTLQTYVDTWAPHPKWFAQEMILKHGNNLVGANSNITVV